MNAGRHQWSALLACCFLPWLPFEFTAAVFIFCCCLLLCRLPEVPVEPKLLPFPFDTDQLFEYNVRRCPVLEETYAYALHTEIDVGVPINLVDPAVYEAPKSHTLLHELDQFITNPAFGSTVSAKKLLGEETTSHRAPAGRRVPFLALP